MRKLKKNLLEWIVFGIGLVLVAGTLAYLAYAGATMGSRSPDIVVVKLGEPEHLSDNKFAVLVEVYNNGDKTAAGIRIEVIMEREGQPEERGELDIPFLPSGATREGWVTFNEKPEKDKLKWRVLGYEKP